jgi:hypothetical protein
LKVGPDAAHVDLAEIDRLAQRAPRDGLRVEYNRDRDTLEFAIDAETPAEALHAVLDWWREASPTGRARSLIRHAEVNRESEPQGGRSAPGT